MERERRELFGMGMSEPKDQEISHEIDLQEDQDLNLKSLDSQVDETDQIRRNSKQRESHFRKMWHDKGFKNYEEYRKWQDKQFPFHP